MFWVHFIWYLWEPLRVGPDYDDSDRLPSESSDLMAKSMNFFSERGYEMNVSWFEVGTIVLFAFCRMFSFFQYNFHSNPE